MTEDKKPKKQKAEKPAKTAELEQKIAELTEDLQRTRADFENYRKRVETEKATARAIGQSTTVLKLLPVIDNIERAIAYTPEDIKDHAWVQGVASLVKNLDKSLEAINVARIDAKPGTEFNPELHEAIQFDEEVTGDKEVIAEELQAGYTMNGAVIRHAMVKVTRQ